jgi:hypothetical protein
LRRGAPRLLLVLALLLGGFALAACQPGEGLTELTIEGLGRAYFSSFRVDALRNYAELSGGVCLEDFAGEWTVTAEQVAVTGLQPGQPLNLQVNAAQLVLEGWLITARHLTSDGNEFVVHDANFESEGLTGTLGQAVVRLDSSRVDATDLQASGPGYRLSGATASFDEDVLTLGDALITTCTCEGEPFYVLVGEKASVNLVGEELHLTRGELVIGRLRIELAEELEVSSRTLQDIKPPLLIEYTASDAAANVPGYGLSLIVPQLQLAENLMAELGLLGLDSEHDLGFYGLLRYRHDGVNALLGRTRGGPRADFSVKRPVNDWLDLTFAVHNRHEKTEDYLHQGLLTLDTTFPVLTRAAGERASLGASFTAAVSSQTLGDKVVVAPRVRFALSGEYRLPRGAYGQLSARLDAENSSYGEARHQFGLRLRPAWTLTSGPFTLDVGWDWLGTNSASPFSTKLDRLTPVNRVSGSVRWQGRLAANTSASATAAGEFSLRTFSGGQLQGFESLTLDLRSETTAGEWTFRPRLIVQLAGLLDPRVAPQRKAYVEAAFTSARGDLELGLLSRYHLPGGSLREGFEILEASFAVPLQFERVRLVPFIGLDVAPLLEGRGGLAVSGHGLQAQFDTCCALLQAGYRLHDNEMTTSFSASFVRP